MLVFRVCEDLKSAITLYKIEKTRLELQQDLEESQILACKPLSLLFRNRPIGNGNNRIDNVEMTRGLKARPAA